MALQIVNACEIVSPRIFQKKKKVPRTYLLVLKVPDEHCNGNFFELIKKYSLSWMHSPAATRSHIGARSPKLQGPEPVY